MSASSDTPIPGRDDIDWRAHFIERFGSAEAIEADTALELSIEGALQPWTRKVVTIAPETGEQTHYFAIEGLEHEPNRFEDLATHIVEAVSNACPIAPDLAGVRREREEWEALGGARYHVCGWYMPAGVRAREIILEHVLFSRPARSLDDLAARIEWWHSRATYEFDLGSEVHDQLRERLLDDIAILTKAERTPPPSGASWLRAMPRLLRGRA